MKKTLKQNLYLTCSIDTPDNGFYKKSIPTKLKLFSNFALVHAQRQQEAKLL